jgi:hypothetical protein
MAEETVTQTAQTTTAQTTTEQDLEKVPTSWKEIFGHPRFTDLKTRAQKAEQQLAALTDGQKAVQEAALKEQNKFKELYEQREAELKTERKNNMRLKVTSAKGLPVELADRLKGETEDEMVKDADTLLAFLKTSENQQLIDKGLPAHKSGGSSNLIDLTTETDPAKVREAIRKGQTK